MAKKQKTTSYSLSDWLGYLTREEVDFLKELAANLKAKNPVIVNIGAGAGTSGMAFAEARPDADLYTIDIRPSGPLGGLEGERNSFDLAGLAHPFQILGDSKEVADTWQLKIDMLFIDGDHTKEGIRGDILGWLPFVKRYGIIAFHDYNQTKWSEVKPAVDDLMGEYYEAGEVNRIKAFKKLKKRVKKAKKK
jgi:predicted O-methyltransferase YrrM